MRKTLLVFILILIVITPYTVFSVGVNGDGQAGTAVNNGNKDNLYKKWNGLANLFGD